MYASLQGGTETILLVDDEAIIVDIGKQMMEKLGYHVLAAGNGKAAVDLFNARHNGIDLVILDMVMPDLTGKEVFTKLREIDSGVRVLLSSGYSIDGEAAALVESGCSGFIQKPFNMKQLDSKIREILDKEVRETNLKTS
jgi:DNA-binding response OmpR family regulator